MKNRPPVKQPPVYPVRKVALPEVRQVLLSNKIPVYLLEAGTEDIMRMEIIVKAGQLMERTPLVASTTSLMLTEGSLNHSSEELNRLLDYYGIFINVLPEKDLSALSLFFLSRHTGKALELASEIIFSPVFPEPELNALMRKRLRWFIVNREKVSNIANDLFFESVFGQSHPYGRQVSETDFNTIDPELVRSFHKTHYLPRKMSIIISGKIHPDTLQLLEKYFGCIGEQNTEAADNIERPLGETEKERHFKKPGAVQTAVRIGSATINKKDPDYTGLKVLNTILGGFFGSRLMQNIREDKGFTYGISSSITSLNQSGYKLIAAEVNPKNTAETIEEVKKEITGLQTKPVSPEELTLVKNYMSGEMVRMFDGPFASAESFRGALEFGLTTDYFRKLSEKINNITPDEILRLTRTYYDIDGLYIITAGP
jgi:predicted Zn-dependent peptidase